MSGNNNNKVTSSCPCRVFSGTEKQSALFSGNTNQPTFMITDWGILSTRVKNAHYFKTKRIVSNNIPLNTLGKREGAPGGSGAPPRNSF